MLLKDIVGHHGVKERFIRSVKNNRISHAQLIAGPEGVGKLSLSIAFAQYISCKNRTEEDSCGVCASCKKYQKLIHPDLHFVYPVVTSTKFKQPVSDNYLAEWRSYVLEHRYSRINDWFELIGSENKQGGIYAQESSEILRKLTLKTFEAEYKIMIIWKPEKMNATSANKLLKILEEPPPKTLFFLISEEPGQIIGTIRSRTQLLKVTGIEEQYIAEALQKEKSLPEAEANYYAKLSQGSFTKALELLSASEETERNFDFFTRWMRNCYAKNVIEALNWAEEISGIGREKQKSFLDYALTLIRECFVLNESPSTKDEIVYLSKKELEFAVKFSPFVHKNNVFDINNELNTAAYHIERNAMPKLVFLDLSLKIIKYLVQPK